MGRAVPVRTPKVARDLAAAGAGDARVASELTTRAERVSGERHHDARGRGIAGPELQLTRDRAVRIERDHDAEGLLVPWRQAELTPNRRGT